MDKWSWAKVIQITPGPQKVAWCTYDDLGVLEWTVRNCDVVTKQQNGDRDVFLSIISVLYFHLFYSGTWKIHVDVDVAFRGRMLLKSRAGGY